MLTKKNSSKKNYYRKLYNFIKFSTKISIINKIISNISLFLINSQNYLDEYKIFKFINKINS